MRYLVRVTNDAGVCIAAPIIVADNKKKAKIEIATKMFSYYPGLKFKIEVVDAPILARGDKVTNA